MMDSTKNTIGYMIIQEFPNNNTAYVIGFKPYGKIWYDYEAVSKQYKELIEDWQIDFDNNEITNSDKPRLIKIQIMGDVSNGDVGDGYVSNINDINDNNDNNNNNNNNNKNDKNARKPKKKAKLIVS